MKRVNFKFKSTALVLLALGLSSNLWGQTSTWSWTPSSRDDLGTYTSTDAQNVTLNGKAWTSQFTQSRTAFQGTQKAIQIGAKGSVATGTLRTSAFNNYYIKKVTVNASSYNGSHKIAISINGTTYKTATATKSWTTMGDISTGTISANVSGEIVITVSNGSRAFYLSTITVEYAEKTASCSADPVLAAGAASGATTSSLTFNCSGGITTIGTDCSITSYGYVWGKSTDPTISDSKHELGTTYSTAGTAFDGYTATGLDCGTTYYMRPYATNGHGTAYGTQASLSTSACPTDHFVDNLHGNTQQDLQGNGYTIPSCDDETKGTGCSGLHYKFIGWSSTQIQTGQAPTEPSGLLKAGGTHDADGTTYYAVWAQEQ